MLIKLITRDPRTHTLQNVSTGARGQCNPIQKLHCGFYEILIYCSNEDHFVMNTVGGESRETAAAPREEQGRGPLNETRLG